MSRGQQQATNPGTGIRLAAVRSSGRGCPSRPLNSCRSVQQSGTGASKNPVQLQNAAWEGLKLGSLYVGSYCHRRRVWGEAEREPRNLSFLSEEIHVYLNSFGARENDKRSMTANATLFSACRPLDRSLKRRGSVIQSAFIPSAWRPWVGLRRRGGPERGSRRPRRARQPQRPRRTTGTPRC